MRDPYLVLGVTLGADQGTIDSAYRRLCRRHHPDVSREPHAGVQMREINAAYHVLRDPSRRRAYDVAREPRPTSSTAWQSAHRAWQASARPPTPPPAARPDSARVRVSPAVVDFGFLKPGDIATKRLVIGARGGGLVRARLLPRGDWLQVAQSELHGTAVTVDVTADPRDLAAFWCGTGEETARLDGWLELIDAYGSTRVPCGAILRRDAQAASWWNPFARRAG